MGPVFWLKVAPLYRTHVFIQPMDIQLTLRCECGVVIGGSCVLARGGTPVSHPGVGPIVVVNPVTLA